MKADWYDFRAGDSIYLPLLDLTDHIVGINHEAGYIWLSRQGKMERENFMSMGAIKQ